MPMLYHSILLCFDTFHFLTLLRIALADVILSANKENTSDIKLLQVRVGQRSECFNQLEPHSFQ